MTFLHPILAGAALAGISIPIIIHLLMRRRRKPVKWAAMRFLLEAYQQQRRRMRLEQLLLLAARCVLIALAGLAIARPLLGSAGVLGGRGAVTLYVLIDNGLAASATDAAGKSALQRHKARALALLDQLDAGAGDRAGLIALGGPAQGSVVPASSGVAALRELISGMNPTQSATDLPGGLAIMRSVLDAAKDSPATGGRTVIAVLSDYLAGSADTERKLTELVDPAQSKQAAVVLLSSRPAENGTSNISVTGLEPTRPVVIAPRRDAAGASRPSPVRVLLRRSGPGASDTAASTVKLALESDGSAGTRPAPIPVGQVTVRWAPGQTEAATTVAVDVGSAIKGGSVGSVVLTASIDNDAINGDNLWRRPIEVRQSLRVGLIAPRRTGLTRPGIGQYEPADWIRLALQPVDPVTAHADPEIDVADIEPAALDPARLSGLDAVIVVRPDSLTEGSWKRLRTFADGGGLVIVTPPAQTTVHLWTDAMVRDMGLPWNTQREPRTFSPAQTIAAERVAASPRNLLSLVEAELPDLAAPVRVLKVLPTEIVSGEGKGQSVTLLKLADGLPLVMAATPGAKAASEGGEGESTGRGLVVMITAALSFDWTDLQSKPLMLPLMQELVRQGVGRARGAYADLAGSVPEAPVRSVELRPLSDGIGTVRVNSGRAGEPMRMAGLWRAVDERGSSRGLLAVNANPAGGRGEAQPNPSIAAWLGAAMGGTEPQWLQDEERLANGSDSGAISSALRSGDDPGKVVLPLLIAALLVALGELVLARWFSHAVVGGEGAAA